MIDTDPGIDDAVALLLALRSPELHVEAVTTVFGNHDIATTTDNALALLALAGRPDIPVGQGAARPLARPFLGHREEVHGARGLGGAPLPAPQSAPVTQPAHELIIDRARAHPGELTLVAIAPLTNLALALQAEPRLPQWVARVVLMGGAYTRPGNITPLAEANVYHDPEAAAQVFAAPWSVHALGLDVTLQATLEQADIARFGTRGTPVADFVAAALPFYQQFYRARKGQPATPMHDPAAIAYTLDQSLFQMRLARVTVDQSDGPRRGHIQTTLEVAPDDAHLHIVTHIDLPKFRALLAERVQ
ncbi:MAG: nucleoside hydrolase [Anaerolineae bacterium]|nr:nucleoside hydrolase [Anaerolineae bacterium]